MKSVICLAVCAALLTACGGRTPHPISAIELGDSKLTCRQIQVEIREQEQASRQLETDKVRIQRTNILLGILGWFFLFPWFLIDSANAEKVEIDAVQKRITNLKQYANEKDCV